MMEKMSPGAKVSETSDLIIHDTEQNIAIKLDKISPRWGLQGERTEVGDFTFLYFFTTIFITLFIDRTMFHVKQVAMYKVQYTLA